MPDGKAYAGCLHRRHGSLKTLKLLEAVRAVGAVRTGEVGKHALKHKIAKAGHIGAEGRRVFGAHAYARHARVDLDVHLDGHAKPGRSR